MDAVNFFLAGVVEQQRRVFPHVANALRYSSRVQLPHMCCRPDQTVPRTLFIEPFLILSVINTNSCMWKKCLVMATRELEKILSKV